VKVYNISPHRSGTRSFHAFCCAHGLRSAHWCGPEAEEGARALANYVEPRDLVVWSGFHDYYASADIFSDFPTPLTWRSIRESERDAKFILIERDANAWVRSVRSHKGDVPLTMLERIFYRRITGKFAARIGEYSDDELVHGYGYYMGGAVRDFADRDDMLFVRLEDPLIGERVAEFMGFVAKFPFGRVVT
jgi:hypothetical protein